MVIIVTLWYSYVKKAPWPHLFCLQHYCFQLKHLLPPFPYCLICCASPTRFSFKSSFPLHPPPSHKTLQILLEMTDNDTSPPIFHSTFLPSSLLNCICSSTPELLAYSSNPSNQLLNPFTSSLNWPMVSHTD